MDDAPDVFAVDERGTNRVEDARRSRLADEQALHLLREHDCDNDEQDPDADASQRVPARVPGDLGGADPDDGEEQAEERARVLEEDDRELGALRTADVLPPGRVAPYLARLS